jgi:transcriptional regulator with XRE-family HTH domain
LSGFSAASEYLFAVIIVTTASSDAKRDKEHSNLANGINSRNIKHCSNSRKSKRIMSTENSGNTGNTFKLLRVASGLNQKELAEKLEVSASYVSLIESGDREPPLEYLRKFSRVLGIPASILLFQSGEPTEALTSTQREENTRLQELFGNVLTSLMQAKTRQKKKRSIGGAGREATTLK